jgi:membrane-associated phospholipid phosphatase
MNISVNRLTKNNLSVQPVHTVIKGRVRYKVKGLHKAKALKEYLELRLLQEKGIRKVNVSQITENVLVIFNPDIHTSAIALLLQNIILDYKKEVGDSKPEITPIRSADSVVTKFNASSVSELANVFADNKPKQHRLDTLSQSTYLLKQFKSFPTPLLTAAAGLSLATGRLANAAVIIGVVITNTVIGYATERQSEKIINEISVNQSSAVVKKNSASLSQISTRRQLVRVTGQRVLISGVISTLALSTLLLFKYELDTKILLAIQKLHAPISNRLMLGITYLGEPATLLLICLGLSIGPLFYARRPQATTFSMAALSAFSLNYWLKILFGRTRPKLWNRLIDVRLHSFPSGHAMMSTVIYGFLGYMLAKQFPRWRKPIFAATAMLIIAIGFSRLYLGVHWPTDVVAGYAAGLMWLIICIFVLELQQKYRSSLVIELTQ